MASVMSENGPLNSQISKDDVKESEGVTTSGSDAPDKPERVVIDDEDDDDVIDEEQLEEYQEMVDQLGGFPDKVKINSISMVAEDHADSRQSSALLYDCIRKPLVSQSVSRDRKLPLVYVLDSILKNVKGNFIPIMEEDVKTWMPIVHAALPDDQRKKLKRVWNMWHEFHIFREDAWKEMGQCFTAEQVATRAADGTLQLPTNLRKEMQAILDDMQSTVADELDKVSLERLADINPDLLENIKKTAQDVLSSGQSATGTSSQITTIVETRSPEWMARSKEWGNVSLDNSHDLITKLQNYVQSSSPETTYTQTDAIQMQSVLAAASTTASLLTNALQRLKEQEANKERISRPRKTMRHSVQIDKALFTNEGVKTKDETVIGSLYQVGLPFVSTADGKRFATQTELSKHLDFLFKKNQLEKSMERTEERGWYVDGAVWTGESKAVDLVAPTESKEMADGTSTKDADPSTFTMPADESRDRCVICGINFKMFFDNENGIYMYNNCREIEVLNDDAAEKESESMLVHITCWRGLGSPPVLTMDQALQEAHH